MPDLTIEVVWMCEGYTTACREEYDPPCYWGSGMGEHEKPADCVCPNCGRDVEPVRIGV